ETLPRVSRCPNVLVQLLGKALVSAFLIDCHFLILETLIAVQMNLFVPVAATSWEAVHRFLVAVNTISLVKSKSL
ncbi:hypothetical protein HOY82DRAFT_453993, partial [Tuber indicum]